MKARFPPENMRDLPHDKAGAKGADMNEDGRQQDQGADDEYEEGIL